MLPFVFDAPAVERKTRFEIRLEARLDEHEQRDVFAIEVFPPEGKPDVGDASFALLDAAGDGAALLKGAGVPFRAVSAAGTEWIDALSPADVLVIGRKSLPPPGVQRLLLAKAAGGLRIVCFEQVATNVFGLRNDDPNTRHAFVGAAGHPLLQGLVDEDFRNWRGASDILECYPDYRRGFEYGRLDHYNGKGFFGQSEFAHWSSQGTVAAFHFEKPRTGNATALLSSGFDMLYTPLAELRVGRGALLLCALDVSNRYGTDPVATRVVNRLLERAARPPAAAPKRRLLVWGNPYWREVFDTLGRPFAVLDDPAAARDGDVLWLGIGDCPARERLRLVTSAEVAASDAAAEKERSIKALLDDEPPLPLVDEVLADLRAEAVVEEWRSDAVLARLEAVRRAAPRLAAFAAGGGTVVVPYAPAAECLDWLPFALRPEMKEVFLGCPVGVP